MEAKESAANPPVETGKNFFKKIGTDEAILSVLVLLSIIGVAVDHFFPLYGPKYWIVMVPLFFLGSLAASWNDYRSRNVKRMALIRNQLLHWGGLAGVVAIVYLLDNGNGPIATGGAGLILLLFLALTTFEAGVHFGWHLCVVGLLLAGAVVVVSFLNQYLWVFFVVALVLLIGSGFFWWRSLKRDTAPAQT